MTTVTADDTLKPTLPGAVGRLPLAPAEGWLTLGFVALLSVSVAWSFDDAAWVLGRKDWGDFYAWAALLGTVVGFSGAKLGWPRWVVHLGGAVGAALIVPLMVGSVLLDGVGSPGELYRATAASAVQAYMDLAVLRQPVTSQTGHYLLWIGILSWSLGQFAGYAVFGHRRPLDAVIVVGIVLLANMAMTANDQLFYLVLFSVAALCVLARAHAFDEESTWTRRRIGDASVVRSLYLRGGALFITTAIIGSLLLTASASSAPLAGFWGGFDRQLIEWGRHIERFLPAGGNSRPMGFGFGDRAAIGGLWESSDSLALTVRVPPGDREKYYWRVSAFDSYHSVAWTATDPVPVDRDANERLLRGLADDPTDAYARRQVTFDVEVEPGVGDFVFSPLDPISVDAATTVRAVGVGGWFSAIETDAASYRVTAEVPIIGPDGDGLTANRLRVAGDDYPAEIRRLYLDVPEGVIGQAARELYESFIDEAGTNPYELARAMEQRFSSNTGGFTYSNDIRGLCGNLGTVDCFARHKRGFCMQYASTMAVLLREAGVPTRLALGALPGKRDPATGIELISAGRAHAWVEVYFPGYGWYAFDPTGGGLSETRSLPAGPVVSPRPSVRPTFGSLRPDERDQEGPSRNPGTPGASTLDNTRNGGNTGLLVALAVLLLVGMAGLAFVAWHRGPRGEVTAEGVWRGIARTAGRFGFGPRPQQTVYEYAGSLGEVLPTVRPELQTVARAKVEVAYGQRELAPDALHALRAAHRRLRVNLLRLALRRGQGRRRRQG